MTKEKRKPGRATARAANTKPASAKPRSAGKAPRPSTDAPPLPPPAEAQIGGKLGAMVALMQRAEGATLDQMCDASGWQAHSVRGALAGALKRNRGFEISSEKVDGKRVYRITGRKDPKAG